MIRPLLLTVVAFAASLFVLCSVGCGGGGAGRGGASRAPTREELRGRIVRASKPLPPPPPRKDVPLDSTLVSDARQELQKAAASKEATLRANALEAMRDVPDPAFRQAIIGALEDEVPVVRFAAAMAAGELELAEARDALVGMLEDRNANVRVAVRFALHKLGITEHSHDLEETAQSDDPGVRGNTALALGLLGEKSAAAGPTSILYTLRRDRHPAVRQQAQEAIWRLGDRSAVEDLVALTVSKFVDDQMVGLLALAAPREPSVREHVRAGLTNDYPEVRLVAARAMGMLGSDDGYALVQKGAKGGDARQRFLAALAYGAIGRSDAQDDLSRLLKDKDARVRVAAAAAVLQLASAPSARVAGSRG